MKTMKREVYKVIGIIVVIISILAILFGTLEMFDIIRGFEDPSRVSVETLDLDDGPKTVHLVEGRYEIWVEGEETIEITVEDDEENSVFQRDTTKSITINERSYEKIGNLQIYEDGNYTFRSHQKATIHITEPISVFSIFTDVLKTCLLFFFGVIGIIGGGLLFALNLEKDDPQRPDVSQG